MKIMFSVFPANKSEKKKDSRKFSGSFLPHHSWTGKPGRENDHFHAAQREGIPATHKWLLLMVLIGRLLRPAGWVLGSFIILPRVQHGLHKTRLITIKDLICMHISCHLISTLRLLLYYCLKFNHYSVHWLQEFYCSNKSH